MERETITGRQGYFLLTLFFLGNLVTASGLKSIHSGWLLFLLLSLGFFVPPGFLIYEAVQRKNRKILQIIRNLSLISLGLTLLTILLNFLSFQASESWGLVLYWLLILVSTPMICSQVWVVGLFGWACLLMTSMTYLKKE